ncbi:homeobox protein araucan-like [Mercenaria mercenaria]|uniref:homeobox protein araucan-like n=1 Tax=Mercenaria mercenaria TaxID=6596 RepID=UPI00234F1D99|nr:homeobox protein araucan-like [Mercenaria mercenaria]
MSFRGSPVTMHRPVTTQTTSTLNIRTSTPKVVYPSVGRQMTSQRCCDTGRPVMMDPVTGAAICSCQLKSGVPTYLSRVPSLPETVYGAAAGHQYPPNVVMGNEATSAFYQMAHGLKTERSTESLKSAPPGASSPYYLEHLMAAHPYNAFYSGFDINSARRKNATRETTSALKAWLYEHRKNPYPTKGEKIMLAIITRMTLTQVSTWFANARRRLKKESKMDDKDIDLSDLDVDDKSETQRDVTQLSVSEDDDALNLTTDLSDISDAEESTTNSLPPKNCMQRLLTPDQRFGQDFEKYSNENKTTVNSVENSGEESSCGTKSSNTTSGLAEETLSSPSRDIKPSGQLLPQVKPKIWSISEIISPKNEMCKTPV